MPGFPLLRSIVIILVAGLCTADLTGCSPAVEAPDRAHPSSSQPEKSPASSSVPAPTPTGEGHTDVPSVAFGRLRGRQVAVTAGAEGRVRIWWLPALEPAADPLPGNRAAVVELDGRSAVFAADRLGGRLWDLDTRRELLHVPAPVSAFAFGRLRGSPVLFTGDRRGRVKIWDLTSGTLAGSLNTGTDLRITALASAQAGSRPILVVAIGNHGDDSGHAQFWDLATRRRTGAALLTGGEAESFDQLQITPLDGRPILAAGSMYGLKRWDLESRYGLGPSIENRQEDGRLFAFPSFTMAFDGRRPVLVTGQFSGAPLQLRDPINGSVLAELAVQHQGAVTALAAGTLDGDQMLLSGGDDGAVRLWNLRTRKQIGGPTPSGPS
ncbi:WD40 repeat domain-containing protein [Nonomuraea glycinis]|uniref:WD40 repeat domain-containing protein n=1 Tax=Nonomuraea glycinis TaxID=2047744 RepID=UPI002E0D79B7|nr:hypothetical protein OHA68_08045 [Nonomuraea glycinis]